jgi:hypothetical protein
MKLRTMPDKGANHPPTRKGITARRSMAAGETSAASPVGESKPRACQAAEPTYEQASGMVLLLSQAAGLGEFRKIMSELQVREAEEKHFPIFYVGEELEIKGGRFHILRIDQKELHLVCLPGTEPSSQPTKGMQL